MNENPHGFLRFGIRPWGLLTAAGTIVCAATLLGFLGRWSWFCDLFAHFRVQYLASLILLGVILCLAKRRKTVAIFAGFACINLLLVLPLYFGAGPAPPADRLVLRAMLLNVNTRLGDPQRVKQVIRETDPHFVVLAEVSRQWMIDLAWLEDSYPHQISRPREDNFGISLFSKFPLVDGEIVTIGTADVPSILASIQTPEVTLRVIATHPLPPGGPNNSRWRNEQLQGLVDYVDSSRPLLLIGDLNATPWSYHFRRLLQRSGLKNSARGYGIQPTWPNFNPLLRIPIDHCLHSSDIVITGRRVGEDVASDHYPLIVDFVIVEPAAAIHSSR